METLKVVKEVFCNRLMEKCCHCCFRFLRIKFNLTWFCIRKKIAEHDDTNIKAIHTDPISQNVKR